MSKIKITLFILFTLYTIDGYALAAKDAAPNWKGESLTGDWGGAR